MVKSFSKDIQHGRKPIEDINALLTEAEKKMRERFEEEVKDEAQFIVAIAKESKFKDIEVYRKFFATVNECNSQKVNISVLASLI